MPGSAFEALSIGESAPRNRGIGLKSTPYPFEEGDSPALKAERQRPALAKVAELGAFPAIVEIPKRLMLGRDRASRRAIALRERERRREEKRRERESVQLAAGGPPPPFFQ